MYREVTLETILIKYVEIKKSIKREFFDLYI